jgi:hypothetical protein
MNNYSEDSTRAEKEDASYKLSFFAISDTTPSLTMLYVSPSVKVS